MNALVAMIAAADAAPVDEALALLLQVIERLKREPQVGVAALLVRSLSRLSQLGVPGAAIALRAARAIQ